LDYGHADRDQEVPILMQPGDVVIHHGNTIHRAEPNRTAHRNRRAFAMVFEGESCRKDPSAYARYEAALSQQHQRMGLASNL
jgi:phytanoyl-CoA hydroxylase